MELESQEYQDELIEYVRWYGGFKEKAEAIAWLDLNLDGWRYVRDTKITYSERLGKD